MPNSFPQKQESAGPNQRAYLLYVRFLRSKRNVPGKPIPSVREFSRLWEIPFGSVNRACNDLIAKGVLLRKGRKTYARPNRKIPDQLPTLAIVTHSKDKEANSFEERLNENGFKVERFEWEDDHTFRRIIEKIAAKGFQGYHLTLPAFAESDAVLTPLFKLDNPCVFSGSYFPLLNSVCLDYESALEQTIEHLHVNGYERIALLNTIFLSQRNRDFLESAFVRYAKRWEYQESDILTDSCAETPDVIRSTFSAMLVQGRGKLGILCQNLSVAICLQRIAGVHNLSIPDDLGIVSFIDENQTALAKEHGITSLQRKDKRITQLSTDLLLAQLKEYKRSRKLPPPEQILVRSVLTIRESTCIAIKTISPKIESKSDERKSAESTNPRKSWIAPYAYLKQLHRAEFEALNLRPYANRSLKFNHAWLGDQPLLHLEAGAHWIHGAQFEIIEEKNNNGLSAITMPSLKVKHGAGKKLSPTIAIPLKRNASAMYFLHGCGFAYEHRNFAEYAIRYEDDLVIKLPLRPFSHGPKHTADTELWENNSNIQDWWGPPFAHFTKENWRHLVVSDNQIPHLYERYLYTLQWINPRPEVPIKSLTISSNPKSSITLGVLAISILAKT